MEDKAPSAGKIRLKIVSPKKIIADVEADSVQIPAVGGIRVIQRRQAPLFCVLKNGQIVIRQGKDKKMYLSSAGICEVRRDICAILVWAVDSREISLEKAQTELENAYAIKQMAGLDLAKTEIQKQIEFYQSVIDFVK